MGGRAALAVVQALGHLRRVDADNGVRVSLRGATLRCLDGAGADTSLFAQEKGSHMQIATLRPMNQSANNHAISKNVK
jgi:hypothetical protein